MYEKESIVWDYVWNIIYPILSETMKVNTLRSTGEGSIDGDYIYEMTIDGEIPKSISQQQLRKR